MQRTPTQPSPLTNSTTSPTPEGEEGGEGVKREGERKRGGGERKGKE